MDRRRKATNPIPGPSATQTPSHHSFGTADNPSVVISNMSVVEDDEEADCSRSSAFGEEDDVLSRRDENRLKAQARTATLKPRPAKGYETSSNKHFPALHNNNANALAHQPLKVPNEIKNVNIDFLSLFASSRDPETTMLTANAWGETRFSRESAMVKFHAEMLLRAQVIDQDTATKLSEPWHAKGILLNPVWEEKHLDPSRIDLDTKIMSYEKAKKIQWRKDAEERKFLQDWRAGLIDENGRPIKKEGELSIIEEKDGGEQVNDPMPRSPLPPLNAMPSIIKEVTTSTSEYPSSLTSQRDSFILSKQTEPRKPKAPQAPTGSTEFGLSDYSSFNYYQLAAICRERGLKSGGRTEHLRRVLTTDDKHIKNGTDRENLLRYKLKNKRVYKTEVPVLKSSRRGGKRKRDNEEDSDDNDKKVKVWG